jgi:hypothetical protein
MSCSARIPVYSLFIALLVPEKKYLFLFDVRALLLLLMYLLGIVSALGTAYVIQWFIKEKGQSVYAMELPRYHIPHWRNVVQNVWSNCANFVWSAGRIIFLISIILWVLQTRGPSENGYFEQTDNLEESYLGAMGKSIEPVVKPLGYDWKIGISLIASVAAREVFVGTMYTLYALEESDSPSLLVDKLRNAKDPESGQPIYTFAVICSLLVFYAFALQCTSTIVVMYKETRSIKWPAVQFSAFYWFGVRFQSFDFSDFELMNFRCKLFGFHPLERYMHKILIFSFTFLGCLSAFCQKSKIRNASNQRHKTLITKHYDYQLPISSRQIDSFLEVHNVYGIQVRNEYLDRKGHVKKKWLLDSIYF